MQARRIARTRATSLASASFPSVRNTVLSPAGGGADYRARRAWIAGAGPERSWKAAGPHRCRAKLSRFVLLCTWFCGILLCLTADGSLPFHHSGPSLAISLSPEQSCTPSLPSQRRESTATEPSTPCRASASNAVERARCGGRFCGPRLCLEAALGFGPRPGAARSFAFRCC